MARLNGISNNRRNLANNLLMKSIEPSNATQDRRLTATCCCFENKHSGIPETTMTSHNAQQGKNLFLPCFVLTERWLLIICDRKSECEHVM